MGKPLDRIEPGLTAEQINQLRQAEQHAIKQRDALAKNRVFAAMRATAKTKISPLWRRVISRM